MKLQEVYRNKQDHGLKIAIVGLNEKKNTAYGINNNDGRKIAYRIDTLLDYWELTEDVYTRVVFKMDAEEDAMNYPCVAFLLDVSSNYGRVMSYAHIGQHGESSLDYVRDCRNANENEYSGLKQELESIGYFVDVKTRFPANFVQGKGL